MSPARTLLPLFLGARAFGSRTGVLSVIAYAVPTALLLTVTGGTWAFFGWSAATFAPGEDLSVVYQFLAVLASVLLLIPAANLSAAAAKLSARRHDRRLSTLALLGASPGTVRVVALAEPLALALAGIAAGLLGYLALLLPVSRIRFQGEPLGYAAMVLPWWLVLALLGALALLSVLSASAGLRRVSVSPLGVRMRQQPQHAGLLKAGIGVLLLLLAVAVAVVLRALPIEGGIVLAIGVGVIAAGLLVLNLIGGWLVQLTGRIAVRRARTAPDLMAAAIIRDVPTQCWHRVSGLAMTGFSAVFLGAGAAVVVGASGNAGDMPPEIGALLVDIRTGLLLTIGIAFALIGSSALINQRVDIEDRMELHASLQATGMDADALLRMSVRTAMIPVLAVTAFGVLAAILIALPLIGMSLVMSPVTLLSCVGVCIAGILLIWLGARLSGRAALPRGGFVPAE